MNLAWQQKQAAKAEMDQAWDRRCETREPMLAARKEKENAYNAQQASWQDLCSLRDRHGRRIDELNRLADRAFGEASAAFERRDGTANPKFRPKNRIKTPEKPPAPCSVPHLASLAQ